MGLFEMCDKSDPPMVCMVRIKVFGDTDKSEEMAISLMKTVAQTAKISTWKASLETKRKQLYTLRDAELDKLGVVVGGGDREGTVLADQARVSLNDPGFFLHDLVISNDPGSLLNGPGAPFKGGQCPFKGPRNPFKGPRGSLEGSRGP